MQLNSFGCGFLFPNYLFFIFITFFFVADVKVVEAQRYLNTSAQSFLKIFANICFQVAAIPFHPLSPYRTAEYSNCSLSSSDAATVFHLMRSPTV